MCELLGLAFNQPVLPSFSFRGFRHRSDSNPDGWGLVAFPDGSAQTFKEPLRALESQLAEFVRDYDGIRSRIFIGHVRYGTVGGGSLADTHPFCRELRGRHVVLAHNGTLRKDQLMGHLTGRFTPVGETDSELALCALLSWMVEEGVELTDYEDIESWLRELNQFGKMNLLFSDGERLYAYRDANGHRRLCFTHRKAPYDRVSLADEDWEVDLSEEKSPDQSGYIIATEPLTDETWTDLDPGGLCVYEKGVTAYGDD